jgi:hypothetical protein
VKKQQTDDQDRNPRFGNDRKPFQQPGGTDREELKQTQDAIDVKELDTRPFNVLWTYQREKSQLSQLNQQIGQQTIQIETMEED